MAYNFIKAKDSNCIGEQEFATATEIKFSKFTSCIGVIAKKGNLLTAVHLVQLGVDKYHSKDDKNPPTEGFNPNTAAYVTTALLPEKPDAVAIVGFISDWNNPKAVSPQTHAGFLKLTGECKQLKKYQTHKILDEHNSAVYAAKIVGNEIVITYQGSTDY